MKLGLGGLLLFSFVAAAQADTLTLRIKSDDGNIEFYRGRKKLSEPQLNQICAAARARKDDIAFERERMTGNDALSAILREAQCLGATHAGPIPREPATKSSAHTRAKPRHKAKARR